MKGQYHPQHSRVMSSSVEYRGGVKLDKFKGDRSLWRDWNGKFKSALSQLNLLRALLEGVRKKDAVGKASEQTSLDTLFEDADDGKEASGGGAQLSASAKKRMKKKAKQSKATTPLKTDGDYGDDLTDGIDYDSPNTKIYDVLSLACEGQPYKIVSQFEETRDGRKAWEALVAKYEMKGLARLAALNEEFMNLKLADGEDPVDFLITLDRLRDQRGQLGDVVSELTMVAQLLAKLPPSFKTLRTVMEMSDIDDVEYDKLKEQIINFHNREELEQGQSGDGTAMAAMGTFPFDCHNCGQRGHKKADCKNPPKNSGGKPSGGGSQLHGGGGGGGLPKPKKRQCSYCHKLGHLDKQCRKKKYDEKMKAQQEGEKKDKPKGPGASVGAAVHGGESSEDEDGVFIACPALDVGALRAAGAVEERIWLLDSGATAHMTNTTEGLTNIRWQKTRVTVATNHVVESVAFGDMYATLEATGGKKVRALFRNVRVVPAFGMNLISAKQLMKGGVKVNLWPGNPHLEVKGVHVPVLERGDLLTLDLQVDGAGQDKRDAQGHAATDGDDDLWHPRLGHVSLKVMKEAERLGLVPEGLTHDGCDTCEVAKHKRPSFKRAAQHRATKPLELVHVDLWGPVEEKTNGGATYGIMFTCDKTRWRRLFVINKKSEALRCASEFVAEMQGLLGGVRVKAWRCDGAGELSSKEFKAWCNKSGIKATYSAPHTPEQNGVAERSWQTVMAMERCLRSAAGLDKKYWGELAHTAVYLINRLPTTALNGDTPYHALFGKHADLRHLRVIGCMAYAHYYDGERRKLDEKAWRGILIGYDEHNPACYKILDPKTGRIKKTAQVTFNERRMPGMEAPTREDDHTMEKLCQEEEQQQAGLGMPYDHDQGSKPDLETSQSETKTHGGKTKSESVGAPEGEEDEPDHEEEHHPTYWERVEPNRASRHKVRLEDHVYHAICQDTTCKRPGQHLAHLSTEFACMAAKMVMNHDVPSSYEEAVASAERELWEAAMDSEHSSLLKNGTWEMVILPEGANVVGGRWVYAIKCDEHGKVVRYKARYVAKGFSQKYGQDFLDTYAAVCMMGTIRLVIAIVARENLVAYVMDVVTAFLQAPVTEDIYVRQPQGYEKRGPNGETLVCKLKKSLYGLKQAPRNWNQELDKTLREFGLEPSAGDPCLYVRRDERGLLIVVVYVDDLIVAGKLQATVDEFMEEIAKRFEMKNLGPMKGILGMEIRRDSAAGTIEILQTAFVERLLKQYGMDECKPVSTPAEGVLTRLEPGEGVVNKEYMSLVGALLYLAMMTRPDIAYAVQALGRHLQSSGQEHWTAAKRVLRYLAGTMYKGIMYGRVKEPGMKVIGFSDSDWGGDRDTRRSITAYIFLLVGGAISWMSRLQQTVALSSAEAEYMAVCEAAKEAIYLRRVLKSLGYEQEGPTIIYEDNQACIAMSENPVLHKRTKHIDMRYHFTRERVQSQEIKLRYVATQYQLADLLTKALNHERVASLREVILGYNLPKYQ